MVQETFFLYPSYPSKLSLQKFPLPYFKSWYIFYAFLEDASTTKPASLDKFRDHIIKVFFFIICTYTMSCSSCSSCYSPKVSATLTLIIICPVLILTFSLVEMGKVFLFFPEEILVFFGNLVGKNLFEYGEKKSEFQFLLCIFRSIICPTVWPQRKYNTRDVLVSLHQLNFSRRELNSLTARLYHNLSP